MNIIRKQLICPWCEKQLSDGFIDNIELYTDGDFYITHCNWCSNKIKITAIVIINYDIKKVVNDESKI